MLFHQRISVFHALYNPLGFEECVFGTLVGGGNIGDPIVTRAGVRCCRNSPAPLVLHC